MIFHLPMTIHEYKKDGIISVVRKHQLMINRLSIESQRICFPR